MTIFVTPPKGWVPPRLRPVEKQATSRNRRLPSWDPFFQQDKFREDIAALLISPYHLPDGRTVMGESFTHLVRCLRRGYTKSKTRWSLTRDPQGKIEKAGFTISRGRGERIYRGGVNGLGVPCNVVHHV